MNGSSGYMTMTDSPAEPHAVIQTENIEDGLYGHLVQFRGKVHMSIHVVTMIRSHEWKPGTYEFTLFDGRVLNCHIDVHRIRSMPADELEELRIEERIPLELTGVRATPQQAKWPIPHRMILGHNFGVYRFDDETEYMLRSHERPAPDPG